MIGTFGSPESEQVGWLRPGTRHTDIASRLALSGIHPFPLNRPKPLGAPARDQGSSVIAHGAIPRQHKVSMSVEIRSEEHTSELQSLMRISYAVFCLKKKKKTTKPAH